MTTNEIIGLATKHLGGQMESSARLALMDAQALWERGDFQSARTRALVSLKFSIGCFHDDFQRALAKVA